MHANIFYEHGVNESYLDAATLAYEAIGSVKGEESITALRPLELELPVLPTGQIDSAFIDRVSVEQGASALFVTRRDLGAVGLNYCFGRSAFDQRSAIVSTNRVSDTTMFGLALHELGHSEGLVEECAPQHDSQSRFIGHCMNLCVMRPVNTIAEMNETVATFAHQAHTSGFCLHCATYLSEKN